MFIGRNKEMGLLEELYESDRFEFLVMYGRRRVGKTSLLQEFSKKHTCIFFSAQEKNDSLNLLDFSKTVQNYFDHSFFAQFSDWEAALRYITEKSGDNKLLLIIDEFPFIAESNPSIKSILQHTIDHVWKEKNIKLILCGSSVSFMENEVMGYKSPLYGRSTSQIEIQPFDYYDSARFFPQYTNLEKLFAYGILGGIPCYLQAFDGSISIPRNIEMNILRTGAFLKEETQLLLKMELREPAIYNSIFEAIASGASRMNDISTKIHEEMQKCSKYINTLRTLKLITKKSPCGEKETTRKTIYRISDNFFAFWYRFLFTNRSYYELLGAKDASEEIFDSEEFSTYMGPIFEDICKEYMLRLARQRSLPFIPYQIGKWWGNNPLRKANDDIDILLVDKSEEEYILCECKFKNEEFGKPEYETLLERASIFPNAKKIHFYAFSKSGFSSWVQEHATDDHVTLIDIDQLFEI